MNLESIRSEWSPRKSLSVFSALLLAGSILLYVVITSQDMIWKDVYMQIIEQDLFGKDRSLLLTPPSSLPPSPTLQQESLLSSSAAVSYNNSPRAAFYHLDSVAILLLLVFCIAGFYKFLNRMHNNRIDRLVLSVFFTLCALGVSVMLLAILGLLSFWLLILIICSIPILLNFHNIRLLSQRYCRLQVQRWKDLLLKMHAVPNRPAMHRRQYTKKSIVAYFKGNTKSMSLVIIGVTITFAFSLFYATMLPVTDFDSLIYHAEIAKILFFERQFPSSQGPSIGIEISGNYPPLFPSIAAGLYLLFGRFDDIFLRILPSIFGAVTVFGTYRISEKIVQSSGKYSLLLLVSTPLFVYNLLIPSATALLATCIVLSTYLIIDFTYGKKKEQEAKKMSVVGSITTTSLEKVQKDNNTSSGSLYTILAGVCIGLATLTSYQSLFYVLVPVCTFIILYKNNKTMMNGSAKELAKHFAVIILSAALLGSIWYARNTMTLGDPLYPWFYRASDTQEQKILDITKENIQRTGSVVTFGKSEYEIADVTDLFRYHPILFPAFSALAIIGLAVLLLNSTRFIWLVVWIALPLAIIAAFGTIFPRYFLPILPALVIPVGFIITHSLVSLSALRKAAQYVVLFLLVIIYVFIGLPAAIANPSVNVVNFPVKLFFLNNAGNYEAALAFYYNGDVEAWEWISSNVNETAKVATFDPRIYYMGSSYNNIVPLDGRIAVPLYSMTDPQEIRQYIETKNIRYIFDSATTKSRLWFELPFTKYIGEKDYFPIYKQFGHSTVYLVAHNNSTKG